MKNTIIIIVLALFSGSNLFSQVDSPLVGVWTKGKAEISLESDRTATFKLNNGKVIKGKWFERGFNEFAIKSEGKEHLFNFDIEGGDELIISRSNSSKKYRFEKEAVFVANPYVDPITESRYPKSTTKSTSKRSSVSSVSSSDILTSAVIIGGGMLLLDAIFGGSSNSGYKGYGYSDDPQTDRMINSWKEQESYEMNH